MAPNIFYPPAATYHRFITGLTGGKMSSSNPPSAIFLTDTPEEGVKKVKSCVTGGGTSVEDHKKNGGRPEVCSIFEMFVYHLIEEDEQLNVIFEECKSGRRFCGQCKEQAARLISLFLSDMAKKREQAKGRVAEYLKYN
jgi:tryptophanyl-tRNA synthetase